MLKVFRTVIFYIALTQSGFAFEKIDLSEPKDKIFNTYFSYLKEMSRKLCRPGTYQKAGKLYKEYTGNGLYVPFSEDESVDIQSIKEGLPLLAKKRDWLKSLHKTLKKKKNFKKEYRKSSRLEKRFINLHKENYKRYKGKKNNLSKLTNEFVKDLIKYLEEDLIALQPYGFPVDYFNLRKSFDEAKETNKQLANTIYFKRKLFEDGIVNPKNGRKDTSFRSLISTVYLRLLKHDDDFFEEDLRYDIESLLDKIKNSLVRGVSYHRRGINKWRKKIQGDINFYYKLKSTSSSKDFLVKYQDSAKRARKALRDYTYEKEARVYKFWSEKDILYRILFTIETILIHEVGRLDNKFGSERRAIVQVILNRLRNKKYNSIDESEDLYPFLKEVGIKNFKKYKWLNVLFKKGQFSFTYFFIPASRGIYCPDSSRSAYKLREENLSFALEVLKFPITIFGATRYFSRASMTGRIDMAKLWSGYSKWPELPGPEILKDKIYRKLYRSNKLRFIGTIKSKSGLYEIWAGAKTKVLYEPSESKFFVYRDPHLFTYFYKPNGY